MKLALSFLLGLVTINGLCQIVQKQGDTISFELVSFEHPFDYLEIDTSSQNIWQIGMPSKTIFDSAFSPSKGIITDTTNPYPVNNHSYFDLIFTENDAPIPEVGFSLFISFKHKFDTDTLKDGGFVTVSFDHGQTWRNAIDEIYYQWHYYDAYPGDGWYNENVYSKSDTLFDNNYGYSGNSGGWIATTLAWHYIPVKKYASADPNQQIVRFNFISDSIDTNKEGWLIDDITIYSLDLGSYTNPIGLNSKFSVFPNPMQDYTAIESENQISCISVYNSNGQIVKVLNPNSNHILFHRDGLSEGTYIIKVESNNRILGIKKLILLK